MAYSLGVDLGTTYTAAALWRDGRAEVATLGTRAPTIPSVLFLREDETILVGEAASRRGLSEPGRVVREFKRRFGDPTPILVGGSPMAADLLMAKLLAWVVETVSAAEGEAPEAVAVTHPANWGPYKCDLLDQAIRQADVPSPSTLTEPVAAAMSYAAGEKVDPGDVVAVYDLGGGTFDAALLRRTEDSFEVLGRPEGIERVGGVDFDQAVFAHVARSVGDALTSLDPDDASVQAAVARLRDECVSAKEALSSDTDVTISVLLPSTQTEVRLTRGEFESLIGPTLAPTVDALARTISAAGLTPADVNVVLLVGGSSRIPLVGQLVAAELGRPVAVNAHPKHVVALGAALSAAGVTGPGAAKATGAKSGDAVGATAAGVATAAALAADAAAEPATAGDAAPGESDPAAEETQVVTEVVGPPTGSPPVTDGPHDEKPTDEKPSGVGPPPVSSSKGGNGGLGPDRRRVAVIAAVVVALLVGTALVVTRGGEKPDGRPVVATAEGEIFLEPASAPGPDPFTDSVAASGLPSIESTPATTDPGAGTASVTSVRGDVPGLYGGTRDNATCDAVKLVAFLSENPAKAAAFAEALAIAPADIPDIPGFVDSLTPVLLLTDTRVTNNGFKDGRPTPRQAVLQAGTAVMIDRMGRPRVKCFCGNPLGDPVAAESSVRYTGDGWPGFDKASVTVVAASTAVVDNFSLVEVNQDGTTGPAFVRPAGSGGEADQPAEEVVEPTSTTAGPVTTTTRAAPSTTARPATTLPSVTVPQTTPAALKVPKSITSEGSVSATSTFSGEFPASLSVDGNSATSWFSTGGSGSTYTWSGSSTRQITKVSVIGNANHANPDFRTGYGFGSVVVQLIDSGGGIAFQQELSLGGTPDPNVSVTMPHDGVMAKSVKLVFKSPEAANCGGFAELQVTALT